MDNPPVLPSSPSSRPPSALFNPFSPYYGLPSATWRSDAESDSITTLMAKGGSKKKLRKKMKSTVSRFTYVDTSVDNAPAPVTPSTPYDTIIESNTGFSPINPSASLPDVLERSESTASRAHLVRVASPLPSPLDNPISHVLEHPESTASRSRSRSPSRVHVVHHSPPRAPSPIDRVLSIMPPTPVTPAVTRPPYRDVRPQLFQDAFVQSIGGAKFDDTLIHVFSARTRAGTAHKPRVLHARSAFLEAASAKFEDELYDACTVKNGSSVSRTCSRIDYGYDGDSDLEDCEQDPPTLTARATKRADKQPETLSFAQLTDLRRITAGSANIIVDTTRTSPGPSDIVSLDGCESESGLSDLIEEARQQIQVPDAPMCVYEDGPPTAVCTPLRPVLKLKTSEYESVPVLEEQFKTPEMVPAALESLGALRLDARTGEQSAPVSAVPISVATASTTGTAVHESKTEEKIEEDDTVLVNGERVLFIKDSAHKTWQALLLYLYNDHLNFAPLRSEGCCQPDTADDKPRCSPKSMYRLADKLGLTDLKKSAFEAIQYGLSKDNIVKELFSDFTWRYPEVLQMEAGVFFRHCTEPTIQAAMSETFQDIAYGQLPHSSVVLDSLFKKFALETR